MKRRVKISKDMKRKGRRAEESEHVFSHESKEAKSEETMEDQQLQFEDPFPDEFEEEVITEEAEQKETKDEDEEENEQVIHHLLNFFFSFVQIRAKCWMLKCIKLLFFLS